jgi:IS30 family transposase
VSRDLSVAQLAEELGLHPVTVSGLVRRGYFPNAYKSGRGGVSSPWRIPAQDVVDYRARQPRAALRRE